MESYEIVVVLTGIIVFVCICILVWMDRDSDRLNYLFSRYQRRAPEWLRSWRKRSGNGASDGRPPPS